MKEIEKKKILTRVENPTSIANELLPTLDCIFGGMVGESEDLYKLLTYGSSMIKDENVLCFKWNENEFSMTMSDYIFHHLLGSIKNSSGILKSINRKDAENFCGAIQIVTAAMIHDKTHIILLSNMSPNAFYKRATLSFAQGHVTFPINTNISLSDLLKTNMLRELDEELGCIDNSFKVNITDPNSVIYLPIPPSTNKHCCVLYDIEVPDVRMFYSKENDKNSLVRIRIDQLHTQYNNLCPWVLHSLQHSKHVKDIYLEYLKNLKY